MDASNVEHKKTWNVYPPASQNFLNDAKYEFNAEVQRRKQLTYSARHKKGGSRSKKCTLPSDYMSKKEKIKMNGDVKTYRMGEMIPFSEFMDYPDDIKQEYITSIQQKYRVTPSLIANMFAVPLMTLDNHIGSIVTFESVPREEATRATQLFRDAVFKDHGEMYTKQAKILNERLIPVCWYTFTSLAPKKRKLYMDKILGELDLATCQLPGMFGVTASAVRQHMAHIGFPIHSEIKRETEPRKKTMADWEAGVLQVSGFGDMKDDKPKSEDKHKKKITQAVIKEEDKKTTMRCGSIDNNTVVSGTLVFAGSSEDAVERLREFIDTYMIAGSDITVTLEF